MASYEMHNFYCLNCGNLSMPLMRPRGFLRESGHRKVMYCPHCKLYINHYECSNDEEAFDFKTRFEAGEFKEEAAESIEFCKKERASNG